MHCVVDSLAVETQISNKHANRSSTKASPLVYPLLDIVEVFFVDEHMCLYLCDFVCEMKKGRLKHQHKGKVSDRSSN